MRPKQRGVKEKEVKREQRAGIISSRRPTFSQDQRRLKTISVIGAGRLGTALARALASRGYVIEAVVARHLKHARRAADLVGTHPRALTSGQFKLLPASDLLLVTTPDDAIAETAERLAAALPLAQRRRTALHASGALSSDALSSLRAAGFHTGSMHPLISVSDPVSGAESLREGFYCIEGDRVAVRLARALVRDLGAHSFSINASDKALYHAAAVLASGHAVALFDIATEMLLRCGLTEKRALSVLMPLIRSTLENLSERGPARALTGTFARADAATVRRHLDALRSPHLRDSRAIYILLGQRSLLLAEKAGADAAALREIERTIAAEE